MLGAEKDRLTLSILHISSSGDVRSNITKIHSNIEEAKELLEQFGLEIRDAPSASISSLRNRHNCYQAELKRLQDDFERQRANEFQDTNNDEFDEIGFRDQSQQRLLDNSERLERSGKKLTEGYKMIIETEGIANQTLRDLSEQRETIQRARGRVSIFNIFANGLGSIMVLILICILSSYGTQTQIYTDRIVSPTQ